MPDPHPLITACLNAAGVPSGSVAFTGYGPWLGGPLPVDALVTGSVMAALGAAAELTLARTGRRPDASLSAEHTALSAGSERHLLIDGESPGSSFAPLSRFVRCAAGRWARTHGNYPHHAERLAAALEFTVTGEAAVDRTALAHAAAGLTAQELEDVVAAAGGCAAALREPEVWAAHPAGQAARIAPLIEVRGELAHPPGRALTVAGEGNAGAGPAAGVRVLDLTRVIAGPVAGRTLAALGAEVLRIDPPAIPELTVQHLDTGPGKRAASLDLADAATREALLAGADVVICGYRPGALSRFGLAPEDLAARHPHLVQVSLSAWGERGPWAERRGFDSLVQVASGIAARCAAPDGTPGALPVQALDHATGHLIAATALRGLAARARGEAIAPARLALAHTAAALLAAPPGPLGDERTGNARPDRHRVTFGEISLIAPPGTLDGRPLQWRFGPRALGGDPPQW